jgi:GNAT superfamily N-acetyltransferase
MHNLARPTEDLSSYPEELGGSWFCITFLKDHPILDGIACVYFDDTYPSGSVIFSEAVLNKYPDIYATWDKEIYSDRMFVSPKYRNKKIGSSALNYGARILQSQGKTLKYYTNDFKPGNSLWKSAFGDVIEAGQGFVDSPTDEQFFDQPIYPSIFFYKREVFE